MFFAANPISGIRAESMRSYAVRLEHMEDVGVDPIIVTLSRLFVYITVLLEINWPRLKSLTRCVPRLAYGLLRISGLVGV